MSWNIFEGAQDTARYERIKKLVKKHKVDVLCLQEANGWHEGNPARLQDFAETTRLTEVAFGNSNTDSKLVIFSRFKILGYIVHKEDFFHCAIQAWIESDEGLVEVVNIHNDPFDEDNRIAEISQLISHIGADAVLCGDFNSLSSQDNYPPSLQKTLESLGNKKYGAPEPRFDVTDTLALHGFIDVAAERHANIPTFPAMTGLEPYQYPTRFDYVFAREKAAAAIQRIQIITDPLTYKTSDHHPELVDIRVAAMAAPIMSPATVEPSRALQFAA